MIAYDDTFHLYRPPRAHHCRVSNVVVDRFDHFCPWMGNTIGARNYRWFLWFLVCASCQVLATIAFCALHVAEHIETKQSEQRERETEAELEGNTVGSLSVGAAVVDILATPILFFVILSALRLLAFALHSSMTLVLHCVLFYACVRSLYWRGSGGMYGGSVSCHLSVANCACSNRLCRCGPAALSPQAHSKRADNIRALRASWHNLL